MIRMSQQPEPVKNNKARNDGLAAVSAFILAGFLIAMVINHVI